MFIVENRIGTFGELYYHVITAFLISLYHNFVTFQPFAGSNLSTDPKCPKCAPPHFNHAEGVYIINSVGIAYHQCEALYIIKPQEDARYRVMIYKGGIARP